MDEMNLERLLDVWLTGGVTDVYGLAMKPWEAALLRSNVGAHFPSLKHQDGYKPNVKTATDFDALPYRVTDRTQYRILNKVAPSHHSDLGTIGGVGCAIAHLEIWKQAAQRGTGWTVVFEWDCMLDEATAIKEISTITAGRPPEDNVGMIRMVVLKPVSKQNKVPGYPAFSRNVPAQCGTQMYILSNAWAAWYVNRLSVIDIHIDWALNLTGVLGGPEMWFLRRVIGRTSRHESGTSAGINMKLYLPDGIVGSNVVCFGVLAFAFVTLVAFVVTLVFCVKYRAASRTVQ